MSRKNLLAIFERPVQPSSQWTGERGEWEEVVKEWVSLRPVQIGAQKNEFVDAAQTTNTRATIAQATYSATMATVDTACRMKLAKPNVVDESDPGSDANFRIFGIEAVINVMEQNRELQLMVTERS